MIATPPDLTPLLSDPRPAAPLQAADSASLISWPGLRFQTSITPAHHLTTPLAAGQVVATAVIAAGQQRDSVRLVTSRPEPQPSLIWRLTHP